MAKVDKKDKPERDGKPEKQSRAPAPAFVGFIKTGNRTIEFPPGVTVVRFKFTKRPEAESDQLRKDFERAKTGDRAMFMKSIAADPAKVAALTAMGVPKDQIADMKNGNVPDGFQVHHKRPLDDGGSNASSNLVLIQNDPYHKVITNEQNRQCRGMAEGESKMVSLPTPDGWLYPPAAAKG